MNTANPCEHTKLYADSFRGPEPIEPCLFCERDRLRAQLALTQQEMAVACEENHRQAQQLTNFTAWIDEWAAAYPLDAFPEPDMTRVRTALAGAGVSLDCVSASSMRHVIMRIRERLRRGDDVEAGK